MHKEFQKKNFSTIINYHFIILGVQGLEMAGYFQYGLPKVHKNFCLADIFSFTKVIFFHLTPK